MDYSSLRNELTQDPLGLGYGNYITSGNHVGAADLLNAKAYTINDYVPISQIQSYVDSHALSLAIEDAVSNTGLPDPIRMCARMVGNLFRARYNFVDMSVPEFGACLGGLEMGGLLGSGDVAAILAMANRPSSRAEVLLGIDSYINHLDIAIALRV